MAAIVVVTILAAGILGGTVSMLTGARAGRSSMWGGMVVALVMLAGWTLGTRVRDRKKLDLPLWHRLTEEQAATLKQYHQWSRTGRIDQDDDVEATPSGPSGHRRSASSRGDTVPHRNSTREEDPERLSSRAWRRPQEEGCGHRRGRADAPGCNGTG